MFPNERALRFNQRVVPLINITAIKVVSNIWITEKVQIANCIYNNASWSDLEDIVLNKIKQLPLPQTISHRLAFYTEFVGIKLKDWIEFHDKYLFTDQFNVEDQHSDNKAINFIYHIKWTNDGNIDLKQTATNIVENEHNLNSKNKYQLACLYCLEDKLETVSFSKRKKYLKSLGTKHKYPMLYYWANIKFAESISFNKDALKLVLNCNCNNYDVAVEFLWTTLTKVQKSECFNAVISQLGFSSFTLSVFSTLSFDEQKSLFKRSDDFPMHLFLLGLIIDWNITDTFLSTILYIINKRLYASMLYTLINDLEKYQNQKSKNRSFHIYYRKTTFETLWKNTPNHLKDYIFRSEDGRRLLLILDMLNWWDNYDLIQLMLSDMSDELKKITIFSKTSVDDCDNYVETTQCDENRLDNYIKAFLSTAEDQEEFKALIYKRKKRKIL